MTTFFTYTIFQKEGVCMVTVTKSKNNTIPIHSPDLYFTQYCEKKYGVNRGIYNTIDEWFFNYGINNILERRQTIVHYLQDLHNQRVKNSTNKVKFGNGGLSTSLMEFCQKNHL
jgi:riboflavin kinase